MKIWKIAQFSCALLGITINATAAEKYYTTAALPKLIKGKILTLQIGGVITYSTNGKYTFISKGKKYSGKWRILRGKVCVKFTNNQRCDRYVNDGGIVYFENANGARYKVSSIQ